MKRTETRTQNEQETEARHCHLIEQLRSTAPAPRMPELKRSAGLQQRCQVHSPTAPEQRRESRAEGAAPRELSARMRTATAPGPPQDPTLGEKPQTLRSSTEKAGRTDIKTLFLRQSSETQHSV